MAGAIGAILREHAVEEIGDVGRAGGSGGGGGWRRMGGRTRRGTWSVKGSGGGRGAHRGGCESREAWRDEIGEEAGFDDAVLLDAKKVGEVVAVDGLGAVGEADGGEGIGEFVIKRRAGLGGEGFAGDTELAAKPGEFGTRGIVD